MVVVAVVVVVASVLLVGPFGTVVETHATEFKRCVLVSRYL